MSDIELYDLLEHFNDDETIELIHAFYAIPSNDLRAKVLEIIESLAEATTDGDNIEFLAKAIKQA